MSHYYHEVTRPCTDMLEKDFEFTNRVKLHTHWNGMIYSLSREMSLLGLRGITFGSSFTHNGMQIDDFKIGSSGKISGTASFQQNGMNVKVIADNLSKVERIPNFEVEYKNGSVAGTAHVNLGNNSVQGSVVTGYGPYLLGAKGSMRTLGSSFKAHTVLMSYNAGGLTIVGESDAFSVKRMKLYLFNDAFSAIVDYDKSITLGTTSSQGGGLLKTRITGDGQIQAAYVTSAMANVRLQLAANVSLKTCSLSGVGVGLTIGDDGKGDNKSGSLW